MPPLAVKLTLAPALIASVSLLQRRWGPLMGGLLTGMPVMAGPVLLALALDFGPKFAGEAAAAGLQAMTAVAVFAAMYANAATRWDFSWVASLAVGFAAYAAVIVVILLVPSGLVASFLAVTFAQWLAIRSIPPLTTVAARTPPPWWDIPLRAALAAALVITIAAVGERGGARLSGLLTPFPIATTVLVVFTHRHDGSAAAGRFLRGLLIGMTSLAVFFGAASATLPVMGMIAAFTWSTIASLVASIGLWRQSRR